VYKVNWPKGLVQYSVRNDSMTYVRLIEHFGNNHLVICFGFSNELGQV